MAFYTPRKGREGRSPAVEGPRSTSCTCYIFECAAQCSVLSAHPEEGTVPEVCPRATIFILVYLYCSPRKMDGIIFPVNCFQTVRCKAKYYDIVYVEHLVQKNVASFYVQ